MKSRIVKAAAVAMVVGTLAAGSVSLSNAGLGQQGSAYQLQGLGQQGNHFQSSGFSGRIIRSQEVRDPKTAGRTSIETVLSLVRALFGIH